MHICTHLIIMHHKICISSCNCLFGWSNASKFLLCWMAYCCSIFVIYRIFYQSHYFCPDKWYCKNCFPQEFWFWLYEKGNSMQRCLPSIWNKKCTKLRSRSHQKLVLDWVQIYQTLNCFELDRPNFEFIRSQFHPPKPNIEPTQTLPKSPNLELLWLKMGWT